MYQTVHVSHLTSFHSSNMGVVCFTQTNVTQKHTMSISFVRFCYVYEMSFCKIVTFVIFPMYNMVLRYINTGTKYHILYSLVLRVAIHYIHIICTHYLYVCIYIAFGFSFDISYAAHRSTKSTFSH